jgi:hypothetical protein
MHLRVCVPLVKIVPLHAVLPKLRIAQIQLLLAQIVDSVAPFTIRGPAANDKCFHNAPFYCD